MTTKHDESHARDDETPDEAPDESGARGARDEEVVDEPVLDGAEDHSEDDVDPRKGLSDPALIRDVETGKTSVNPYG